MFDRPMKTDMM